MPNATAIKEHPAAFSGEEGKGQYNSARLQESVMMLTVSLLHLQGRCSENKDNPYNKPVHVCMYI